MSGNVTNKNLPLKKKRKEEGEGETKNVNGEYVVAKSVMKQNVWYKERWTT